MNKQTSITDSPWFWVLIFAGMALVALLAVGPKYGPRQARLELQYQARERIAERAAGNSAVESARMDDGAERRDFASPEDTLIPLWPLAVVLSIVVLTSAIMLFRGRGRPGSLAEEGPP